ncbi:unnamed protein product [Mucor hiemalis]
MSDMVGTRLLHTMGRAVASFTSKLNLILDTKSKRVGITVAIVMTLIHIIRDRVFKPPKNLRHIPYFGYYSVFKSLYKGESLFDRGYRVNLPLLNSGNSIGVYLEPGRGGWEVHISDPEDVKKVLLKHEIFPKLNFSVGNEATLVSKFVGKKNMVLLSGHEWKSQRMVINPAFRRSLPVNLFGRVTEELFLTMENMNKTVDISDLLMRWTLEAIGRAGFDFNFNSLSNMENNEWVDIYNDVSIGIRDRKFFLFPSLEKYFLWLFADRQRLHKRLDKFLDKLDEVIKNKRKLLNQGNVHNSNLQENEKDLLTLMIESEFRGEGALSNEEIKNNLCLFFIAGHDTTASALSSIFYNLAKHPEMQEKAREEAISILGDEPVNVIPTIEDTKKMVYINRVMKETLRLQNPVPRVIARKVTEDTVLTNGTSIPKGSLLTINIFNLHHKDELWKDSSKFNPDRFAENEEATRGAGEGLAWAPFGDGSRKCIGMNFSLNEQRVLLSMMLRKFTWSIPENSIHKDGLVTGGFPIVSPHELDMTFHKRY